MIFSPGFLGVRNRMGGPNGRALKTWIGGHMPELDQELGPLPLDEVRRHLNEITGCNVQGGDSIEAGSAVFLAALKAKHGGKEAT